MRRTRSDHLFGRSGNEVGRAGPGIATVFHFEFQPGDQISSLQTPPDFDFRTAKNSTLIAWGLDPRPADPESFRAWEAFYGKSKGVVGITGDVPDLKHVVSEEEIGLSAISVWNGRPVPPLLMMVSAGWCVTMKHGGMERRLIAPKVRCTRRPSVDP